MFTRTHAVTRTRRSTNKSTSSHTNGDAAVSLFLTLPDLLLLLLLLVSPDSDSSHVCFLALFHQRSLVTSTVTLEVVAQNQSCRVLEFIFGESEMSHKLVLQVEVGPSAFQFKLLVCLAGEVLDAFEIERKEPKMAAGMHSRVYISGRGPSSWNTLPISHSTSVLCFQSSFFSPVWSKQLLAELTVEPQATEAGAAVRQRPENQCCD